MDYFGAPALFSVRTIFATFPIPLDSLLDNQSIIWKAQYTFDKYRPFSGQELPASNHLHLGNHLAEIDFLYGSQKTVWSSQLIQVNGLMVQKAMYSQTNQEKYTSVYLFQHSRDILSPWERKS